MTLQRIIIIDDEAAIRRFLQLGLGAEGYIIDEAATAREGIQAIIGRRPDAIILDLGLPDQSGLDVIKTVRSWSTIPIIVLTAQTDDVNKVAALDAGADDYLTKPFSVPELLARLRVAARHASANAPHDSMFRSGSLTVDRAARIVTVAGQEVRLTATEYAILQLLMQHAGKVVTQRQILQQVWGPNAVEHTQYLRVYLGHLRRKLECTPNESALIVTEPGVGYRLLIRPTPSE